MHRDASYSSFTVLVRYWLILYVLAYCYNIDGGANSIHSNSIYFINLIEWSEWLAIIATNLIDGEWNSSQLNAVGYCFRNLFFHSPLVLFLLFIPFIDSIQLI